MTKPFVLYLSVVAVAICGIVYELLIGSTSSYLFGDSVWQFSVTIGLFMSAMGLGSYLSQHIKNRLLDAFILIETYLGLLGGGSVMILFGAYAFSEDLYRPLAYLLTIAIGTMVGLEIPLLLRMLEEGSPLRKNAATVLALDYSGGLVGSIGFPLLLLPRLGLVKTAIAIGLINVLVALLGLFRYQGPRSLKAFSGVAALALCVLLVTSTSAEQILEGELYRDKVVFSKQTPYQHLVLTRYKKDLRLFIDGNLQFSTLDEYRYHEALIHVPLTMAPARGQALVLGGGDGLALRELRKYPFSRIVLVDLDPQMTELARKQPDLLKANGNSLSDPRVKVLNTDAMKFLENSEEAFSLIVIDLPDPHGDSLNKLYTKQFYQLAKRRLSERGALVIQASSPFFSRKAYWCVSETAQAAGLHVKNYHLNVPSFGDWGFVMGSLHPLEATDSIPVSTRYLTSSVLPTLFSFGKDESRVPVEVNTLSKPVLLKYYRQGWRNGQDE